ncbi:hypothetical protein ABS735_28615 [Streptomyces sp. MMCC 100]|uniref:hypothetical protein n=1 Tax=Streptomyces sp. MMCC 100 TaxID=3163555 RepID=UPI0035958F8A
MTTNDSTPGLREQDAGANDCLRGVSSNIVPQAPVPRVAGRIQVYRGHRRWYRHVLVDDCPGCGMPHLHNAPWRKPASMQRTAPCGTEYVIDLLPRQVAR